MSGDLRAAFDRFVRSAVQAESPDDPEPDEVRAAPGDDLLRLALILEPYARYVVHKRDARPGDLFCGRPSIRGNPHRLQNADDETERLRVIRAYALDFAGRSGRQQAFMLGPVRRVIRNGYRLVCYCAPQPCHAQVLAAWALGRRILASELGVDA